MSKVDAGGLHGADWVLVSSATAVYPSGGQGGTTGTASSSDLALAKQTTIYGAWVITVLDTNTDDFIFFTDKDGTDLFRLDTQNGPAGPRHFLSDFGPHGISVNGGFGARTGSTNLTLLVAYQGFF